MVRLQLGVGADIERMARGAALGPAEAAELDAAFLRPQREIGGVGHVRLRAPCPHDRRPRGFRPIEDRGERLVIAGPSGLSAAKSAFGFVVRKA